MGTTLAPPPSTNVSACGRASARQLWWAIAFSAALTVATLGLRHLALPPFARLLIPVLPLLAGLMYLLAMVRDLRRQLDELQLRIYLEAAAVVVGGLFIIMLTYPTLQEAGVPALDYSIVLALIVLLGAAGYYNARRRYR